MSCSPLQATSASPRPSYILPWLRSAPRIEPAPSRPSARCSTKLRPCSPVLACACGSPCVRHRVSGSPSPAPRSSATPPPLSSPFPDRRRNRTLWPYAMSGGLNLVLETEDVFMPYVEPVRPQMSPAPGIEEPGGDAHAVRRLTHAAFKHVVHAQIAPNVLYVHGPALVGEARATRDHREPGELRQGSRDVLDEAAYKTFLLGAVRNIREGKHRYRWLFE